VQLAVWCGQASYFLVLALYLQDGRGLRPLQAGLVFTILAAAYFVTSLNAPRLTIRFGRDLISAGALVLAGGHLAMLGAVVADGSSGPLWVLAPGLVLVGAGQGLTLTPLTTTVLGHTTPEHAGGVSGVLSTMQQVGNALGVAVIGIVFFGSLDGGETAAFGWSLVALSALLALAALLSRRLSRTKR
jgi:MFS family permease